jgi:hypothetical protein
MKFIFGMLLLSVQAMAAPYSVVECAIGEQPILYHIQLKDESVARISYSNGFDMDKTLFENARIINASERFLDVNGMDNSEIDWSKEEECFVFRKLSHYFKLDISADQKSASGTLYRRPNVVIRPGIQPKDCDMPRVMPPQPDHLSCTVR